MITTNAQLEQLCEEQRLDIDVVLWALALNSADITDITGIVEYKD